MNYGAYTSFAVEGGGVRGLNLHLERLDASARELFGTSPGEARLREMMQTATAEHRDCWLRVSLFSPDISPRTPSWQGEPKVMTATFPPPPPLASEIRLRSQPYTREAPHLKHVATFGLIRARRSAQASGFDDALFVDASGRVSEGSLWNIGFVSGDRVVWPQAAMLGGVAQALVDRGLAQVGLSGTTEPVTLADISAFDSAFICNSATPACPVSVIDGHAFRTDASLTRRLAEAWSSNPLQPI